MEIEKYGETFHLHWKTKYLVHMVGIRRCPSQESRWYPHIYQSPVISGNTRVKVDDFGTVLK